MPVEIADQLTALAAHHRRTLTGQIIWLIKQAHQELKKAQDGEFEMFKKMSPQERETFFTREGHDLMTLRLQQEGA
ncbi:hypothetical protein [Synechococcus sp. ROS8604]|uniref:hypothetical protein n=1 Tax=Synechococcus sp. ROS8604 TaxID=1442557 RepID=UPI001645942E|nr:hypothetical protein [Synechococcus sp. ROS8604]QNI89552.1 hypothetical protein SynROS8604_02936 [Synechococcus sp. ROS8604]